MVETSWGREVKVLQWRKMQDVSELEGRRQGRKTV